MTCFPRSPTHIALLVAVVIRVFLVFAAPYGVAVGVLNIEGLNDEPSHYNYIRYLSTQRAFPVQTQSVDSPDAFERNEFEYYQPPLYYLMGAVVDVVTGPTVSRYAARLLSLLFGLLTLVVVARVLQDLGVPDDIRTAGVVFLAFMPTHAYFCAMVSNDSLSWLVAAVLTAEALRVAMPGRLATVGRWDLVRQALPLAAGLYTKTSLLLFFPVIAVAYGVRLVDNRRWTDILSGAGAMAAALLLAAPWYLRNQRVYGSLTAFDVACGPPRTSLLDPTTFVNFVKYSIKTFWFPMQHIPGSRAAGLMGLLGALVLVGVVVAVVWHYARRHRPSVGDIVLGALLLLNLVGYVRFNWVWPHAEGRFLLPSVVPIALAMGIAVHTACRRWQNRWAVPVVAGVVAVWGYGYLVLV